MSACVRKHYNISGRDSVRVLKSNESELLLGILDLLVGVFEYPVLEAILEEYLLLTGVRSHVIFQLNHPRLAREINLVDHWHLVRLAAEHGKFECFIEVLARTGVACEAHRVIYNQLLNLVRIQL